MLKKIETASTEMNELVSASTDLLNVKAEIFVVRPQYTTIQSPIQDVIWHQVTRLISFGTRECIWSIYD